MKKLDLKDKGKKEMENLLKKSEKEILDLKFQNSMGNLKDPHKITMKRKEIAKIYTAVRIKDLKK